MTADGQDDWRPLELPGPAPAQHGGNGGRPESGPVPPRPASHPPDPPEAAVGVPRQRTGGQTDPDGPDANGALGSASERLAGGSDGPHRPPESVAAAHSDDVPADPVLVQRIRDGDDAASEELYRRHAVAVRRYARTCCRDSDTADDLTNEVFAATLQAVNRGAGPHTAVRAYLLTSVRRVAASWAQTARREQLVEDFAVFAVSSAAPGGEAAQHDELGADVRAMHEAEQSMAVQAFRSLPERWQTVLWHTTVEESSPREVAPLLGLTPNATAVLAHRAREGLKQAYLQAHVSQALTTGGGCAQYADRLGAFARGGLRSRAERGLRHHLTDCTACQAAALEVSDLNQHIRTVLPVAVIGWFAVEYSLQGVPVLGGAAGGGALAGSATGSGAGGATGGVGAPGVGAPVKAGMAAAVAATVTAAAVALALLSGNDTVKDTPPERPEAVAPVPDSGPEPEASPAPDPAPEPTPDPEPEPAPDQEAEPAPPSAPDSLPEAPERPDPEPEPAPEPSEPPESAPAPDPEPPVEEPTPEPPVEYQVRELGWDLLDESGTDPTVRLGESSWLWERTDLSIGGEEYAHGITVSSDSSVVIDLNRPCSTYRATVGMDDASTVGGAVFSVFGDGALLWESPEVTVGEPAVEAEFDIAGVETLQLEVAPRGWLGETALANWAESELSCS